MTELQVAPRPAGERKARRQRGVKELAYSILLPLLTFAVFALAWQLMAGQMDNFLVPSFTETAGRFFEQAFGSGQVWQALWTTNQALIVGYALAVAVGVPLGLITARSKVLAHIVDPYLDVLLSVPIAPLMPLVLMALGLGLSSRSVVVALFAVIVIAVNTRAGVRGVDQQLIEMARSFGSHELRIWRKILLPGAAPAILTGLRLGLARAVDGMVVVELLLVSVGVGKLIVGYRAAYDAANVFATIAVVALESAVLLSVVQLLEKRVRERQVAA